jgi:NADPH:quinone reductase-like Zn-dependent oxidoreductase
MRAVVYDRYGSTDSLRVEDVPTPSPAPKQVLVRVAATSINLSDWETLRGAPLYSRIGGLRRPARRTLGSDIAGRVEGVGSEVSRFRAGDEVYGDNLDLKGGFAEFAVAPESTLAHKPKRLTFAEASTIPQAGAIALQGTAPAGEGRRILINGAGGGSGSFAIQLAKRAGAHVTGVDNAGKLDFMRSLGADEVIDYRRRDFTRTGERYDLVLDLVASRSPLACGRALARGGTGAWAAPCRSCSAWRRPARSPAGSPGGEWEFSWCVRAPRGSGRSPTSASPARWPSISTAPSRSTTCPRRCATSAKDTPTARPS